jgi:TRAP-type C4-dicarboxylate transport system permease small subunit
MRTHDSEALLGKSWKSTGARIVAMVDRGLGVVDAILLGVWGVLLAANVCVVLGAVVFRYGLNASLVWGEALARYLAVWLVFLGLGCAHRRSEHVALQSVLGRIPGISARLASWIGELISFVFCVAITCFGAQATAANFARHQVSPALHIEIAWIYLAIPVGFGILALQSAVRLATAVTRQQTEAD